ncbi:MAG: hypothetical protein JO307_25460 [Bryobacterales bacterium]|nr:hypothetical protein [Bryobacterales bacterium]MBV9397558.1 hypothetical protein [Bryobacterales bacterium]
MKLFSFIIAAAPLFAGVNSGLLNLVMPDAQAITGVQADAVRSSPFGQYVISQIQLDPGLNQIIGSTGFDPRRDLHEIVAASPGTQSGLVIGRGTFQPSLISYAAIQAGAVSTNYRGIQILSGNGASQTGAVAFLDNTTALLGDVASVKAAIDRYIAGAVYSAPLAQQAIQVSAVNDIWFVASESPAAYFSGKAPNQGIGNLANAFQSIQQTSGGVKFASTGVTVGLALVARSPQDAQALVDIGKFLVTMVQSNGGQNAGATNAATLLQGASFNVNGSTATVSLSLPEQQIEQLLMPAGATPKSRRAAAR